MDKPEWRISDGPVPYQEVLALMEARVADIRAGRAGELVWLLEHPPLYTAGTSSKVQDLLQPMRFPVHVAGRGAVIPLDARENDEVWILANNHPVARGEIHISDEKIAITVTRAADVYDFMAGAA